MRYGAQQHLANCAVILDHDASSFHNVHPIARYHFPNVPDGGGCIRRDLSPRYITRRLATISLSPAL